MLTEAEKYAVLEDLISGTGSIDTMAWITSYEGCNDQVIEWVAQDLDATDEIEDMEISEQVEYLGEILDGMGANPLEWITNISGLNHDVLDWVAEQVGYDFDEE